MRLHSGQGWCRLLVATGLLFSLVLVATSRGQEPNTGAAKTEPPATAAASATSPAEPPAVPATTEAAAAPASAPSGPSNAKLKIMADTVWTLITGMLVFFMNLGF